MKPQSRFVKSIVAAARDEVQMPWARGARRAAFIAKRQGSKLELKRA